jgi:murein DD-endopeptidase MepM/ murein hydrolase activator NlpD
MIAFVGMITFGQYQKEVGEKEVAEAESMNNKTLQETEDTQMTNTEHMQAELDAPIQMETPETVIKPAPSEPIVDVIEETVLQWPIEGKIILNYSMDRSVYFSTLDQYKYNPAIVISGNVGDEVRAAGTGKVISVKEEAQTGMTVRMVLGEGYELIIGQLDGVRVKEGQKVNKGELIGYVAQPSKYYVVEGPNVYFQLLKDGNPVNPLEYMGA